MIVIHNFAHAYYLYQQGLIPFRLLQDQAMILNGINSQPDHQIDEAYDINQSDIDWLLQQPEATESYDVMLGGYFHVCQVEADLKQIVGMHEAFVEAHDNRLPNVTEIVMSWDVCDYLSEKDESAEWAVFIACWNDAGGNVFYVPKCLWKAARVEEHIAATNQQTTLQW